MYPLPLTALLGAPSTSVEVEAALQQLGTVSRPEFDEDEPDQLYDWVLVRRQGIELGFVCAAYLAGAAQPLWRSQGLILSQITFYSDTRQGVSAYSGQLPHQLTLSDKRDQVRQKLQAFEATRHSYLTDRWDTETYRLVVAYKPPNTLGSGLIDSVHLKLLAQPLPELGRCQPQVLPSQWLDLFGLPRNGVSLAQALIPLDLASHIQQAQDEDEDEDEEDEQDEREMDFLPECGLMLYFEHASKLRKQTPNVARSALVLGGVKFHRARDLGARQYTGELPFGLSFEDSPQMLLNKITAMPDKHDDSVTTGRALWHLPQCSLQVLYSNIDNHLFRIMLMAPGYWHEFRSEDA